MTGRSSTVEECDHEYVKTDGVERCRKCGLQVIDIRDVEFNKMETKEHTLSELMLLVIHELPENMSMGITKLMKELFIIEKDGPDFINDFIHPRFYPHHYGPMSDDVNHEVDEMEVEGLIRIKKEPTTDSKQVHLTAEGIEAAKKIISEYSEDEIRELRVQLRSMERMNLSDLMRHVYTKYPIYTTKSKIKDDVLKDIGGKDV